MNLRDQAYTLFTAHLLDRRLAPGQFVTQRELAQLTCMPLGAIREMIPRLEAEGLLHSIPQRGLQVAHLDIAMVRDAFHLREIIEVEAIRHFVQHAPDEAIAGMRRDLDRLAAAAVKGVTPALLAEAQGIDWGFHDTIVEFLGNRLLADVHRVNAIRIRMIMYERVTLSRQTLPPALSEHAAIVAALYSRDEAAATAALRAHLDSAKRRGLSLEPAAPSRPARPQPGEKKSSPPARGRARAVS
jgi:DNA-binding GntR family transcriptional regulator